MIMIENVKKKKTPQKTIELYTLLEDILKNWTYSFTCRNRLKEKHQLKNYQMITLGSKIMGNFYVL